MMPKQSLELEKRIRLVRRDIGSMLFHFTRASETGSAGYVLDDILRGGKLIGSGRWSDGVSCVCFTEAPIQEFNSVFALNGIASNAKERPRYEPYGIAVSKNWLFSQGGRPVIYDSSGKWLPDSERYRWVKYDPVNGVDYTWEREWRVKVDALELHPAHTLVIVPSSGEAFDLAYRHANEKVDLGDGGGEDVMIFSGLRDDGGVVLSANAVYHVPKWLVVSLDVFGF